MLFCPAAAAFAVTGIKHGSTIKVEIIIAITFLTISLTIFILPYFYFHYSTVNNGLFQSVVPFYYAAMITHA